MHNNIRLKRTQCISPNSTIDRAVATQTKLHKSPSKNFLRSRITMARNAIQLASGPRWFPWTTLQWNIRSTCATIVWSDAKMTQPPHQEIKGWQFGGGGGCPRKQWNKFRQSIPSLENRREGLRNESSDSKKTYCNTFSTSVYKSHSEGTAQPSQHGVSKASFELTV
jgi:hypothetical protein